jgi:ATP-binding cassette subfamily F protein 3
MVKQAVGTMSGGEKARLVLAMIVWQRPNLLLLDEPTNHLDLATREALAMALNEFEGTVMLVSHDRALLRAVCDEFWLVGRGEIKPFDGDLDDYQRYLLDESRRLREEAKLEDRLSSNNAATENSNQTALAVTSAATEATTFSEFATVAKPVATSSAQRKLDAQRRQELNAKTKPIKKLIEQADKKIAALHTEKTTIEANLCTQVTPAEMASLGQQLKKVTEELETLEMQWLEWAAEVEAIEAAGLVN